MPNQSRSMSAVEATTNTGSAFVISTIAYSIVMPLMGFQTTFLQNVTLVVIFSLISIARNFVVRRVFNYFGRG